MNILFVNPVGVVGGAERALLTILIALGTAEPNCQLHLILGTNGPLVEMAQALGVQVKVLQLPDQLNQLGDSDLLPSLKGISGSKNLWLALFGFLFRVAKTLPNLVRYLGEFRQAIREIHPDLIHSNGIKTHLLITLAGSMDVPVVWHIHDFYGSRPLIPLVLRWLSKRANLGIAISEAVAQDARVTLPDLPIEVIYNAVDVNYFSPELAIEKNFIDQTVDNPNFRKNSPSGTLHIPVDQLTITITPIRVGMVATFARWKGHEVFLEAAAKLLSDRADLNVHFYIIGGAIYQTKGSQFSEQELRELASVLEIADKVDFLGFQQNIAEVYRWLDIVVHASTGPEPFGLAIVEAMACGKPVIVSQGGGAAELFTHNYDAVGVPPGDRVALSEAMQHLIDNPQQRQYLSQNARSTVLKRFHHHHLAEQILTAYKKCQNI